TLRFGGGWSVSAVVCLSQVWRRLMDACVISRASFGFLRDSRRGTTARLAAARGGTSCVCVFGFLRRQRLCGQLHTATGRIPAAIEETSLVFCDDFRHG